MIFACALLFPGCVLAEKNGLDMLVNQANMQNLSQHAIWLKLLHYEPSLISTYGVRSAIHDDSFFVSDTGKIDPAAELEATLRAFALPLGGDVNQHAQCRFPARFLWLKSVRQYSGLDVPDVKCPSFYEWTLNNTVHSISIVYATGYLGNPASYYGHTLLKLNSSKEGERTELLDVSVNYGAIVPDNEDPLTYIFKGIFGGYDGGFSHIRYYFHNHNYGENELRNLWEYELNLDQKEVDLVVAHAWELLGKRYTYLFFRKNCAYRMAEILEIVEGVDIIPSNPVFTLPQALLKNLAQSTKNGHPLVNAVRLHPSRQSRLYTKFDALTASEKAAVQQAEDGTEVLHSAQYKLLPLASRQIVLDTLLDYYQFAKISEVFPEGEAEDYYREVLTERYMLPPGEKYIVQSPVQPPHEGRRGSMVSMGPTHNKTFGAGLSLVVRPAYYDVLDADSGHVQDSVLSMGRVQFFARDGNLKIHNLDVVKIESVNSAITGLPGDNGKAWKLRLGLDRQNLACQDCLTLRFEGDIGRAVRLHPKILAGVFVGGSVQDNRENSGNLIIRASAFSYIHPSSDFGIRLLAEFPEKIDGTAGEERFIAFEARQQLRTNIDFRLLYEKKISEEYSLSLGYYF
jgi:hypothetical protein